MAETTLENGTVIFTDSESFEDGAEVYIVNEEGEKIPLPLGEYVTSDGKTLTVEDGGKISSAKSGKDDRGASGVDSPSSTSKGREKNAPAAPKVPTKPDPKKGTKSAQDKLAEGDIVEEEEKIEEEVKEDEEKLMDEAFIVDLINKILDERFPVEIVEEGLAADEFVTELQSKLASQAKELTELKAQDASKGVTRVKRSKATPINVDLKSLSTEDRVKALFTKYNS
tara:strand:- start:5514 stop:6191 length:678 start_codon:yes stop_codon:yes gene_type:complete